MAPGPWTEYLSFVRRGRFWRLAFTGTVLLYAAAVLSLGGTSAARHVFRLAALAWVILAANLTRRPPATGRLGSAAGLVGFNLALFLVLAELCLRSYVWIAQQPLLVQQGIEPFRLQPRRNYGGLLFTNRQGYASREFEVEKRPGVRRIVVLGDSFAVGVVRQDQGFPRLLEASLAAAEVYNFGVASAGPREYLAILRGEALAYEPDLVLVSFFVGNDVTETWRLPQAGRLEPAGHYLHLAIQRLARLVREASLRPSEPASQPFAFPTLSRETHLQVERRRLGLWQRSRAEANEEHWREALGYLEEIQETCRRHGIGLAVVLIPDEFQVQEELLEEVLREFNLPREDIDLDGPQRRLAGFLSTRGIPCLDLLPVLRNTPDCYRPRDTHWNERGNEAAARAMADWIAGGGYFLAAASSSSK